MDFAAEKLVQFPILLVPIGGKLSAACHLQEEEIQLIAAVPIVVTDKGVVELAPVQPWEECLQNIILEAHFKFISAYVFQRLWLTVGHCDVRMLVFCGHLPSFKQGRQIAFNKLGTSRTPSGVRIAKQVFQTGIDEFGYHGVCSLSIRPSIWETMWGLRARYANMPFTSSCSFASKLAKDSASSRRQNRSP